MIKTSSIGHYFFMAVMVSISLSAIACEEPEVDLDEHMASMRIRSFCITDVDSQMDDSFGEVPVFADIQSALGWTLRNLPSRFKSAIKYAGKIVNEEMTEQALAALSVESEKFELYLHRRIQAKTMSIEPYVRLGCDVAVFELLANELFLRLNLNNGSLKTQFQSLGIRDSYAIQNAFMFMLALDASNIKWDESWFAR